MNHYIFKIKTKYFNDLWYLCWMYSWLYFYPSIRNLILIKHIIITTDNYRPTHNLLSLYSSFRRCYWDLVCNVCQTDCFSLLHNFDMVHFKMIYHICSADALHFSAYDIVTLIVFLSFLQSQFEIIVELKHIFCTLQTG